MNANFREDIPFCRFCQHALPYSSGKAKCPSCHRYTIPLTEKSISILPKSVREKRERGEDFMFLDVRDIQERDIARIQETILIPLSHLTVRYKELPKEKEIIIHCHHGGRSRAATLFLLSNGFTEVKNMAGGIDAWSIEIDQSVPRY